MNEFRGKRALVIGLGKSGVAAARLLHQKKARVVVTDERPANELKEALSALPASLRVETGSHASFAKAYDLIVVSPGVDWNLPFLVRARKKGVPVWPELELAWRCVRPYQTAAVTGTNGKTTTTALLGEILRKTGRPVVVGGNIGVPLSALARKISRRTFLVLEVSSYQLEGHQTFHPNVGAVLNVTPDHLGRHGTMRNYAAAKARLFRHFQTSDTAVLNRTDRWCRRIGGRLRAKKKWFPARDILSLASLIRLPGSHNLENAMAAVLMARALGVPRTAIAHGLRSFRGVPHRLQTVGTISGARYVNDSKSTNVDSSAVALRAFREPIILILGGRHKGSSYRPLRPLIKGRVRHVLTIGEAQREIARDLDGRVPLTPCGDLKRAVRLASRLARPGEVVLLSPACASFDQYRNFEERGRHFVRLVKGLRPKGLRA